MYYVCPSKQIGTEIRFSETQSNLAESSFVFKIYIEQAVIDLVQDNTSVVIRFTVVLIFLGRER